jgi:hypothetical protein
VELPVHTCEAAAHSVMRETSDVAEHGSTLHCQSTTFSQRLPAWSCAQTSAPVVLLVHHGSSLWKVTLPSNSVAHAVSDASRSPCRLYQFEPATRGAVSAVATAPFILKQRQERKGEYTQVII